MNITQLVSLPVWLIALVVVATFLWFVFQKQYEHILTHQRVMEEALAVKRQTLYEDFVNKFWAPTTTGQLKEDEAVEFLRDWSRAAWLVSSDAVIRALIRVIAGTTSTDEANVVGARLFVALRKHMGNPSSLKERDWMRLTIKRDDWNQIEKFLRVPIPDRTHLERSP